MINHVIATGTGRDPSTGIDPGRPNSIVWPIFHGYVPSLLQKSSSQYATILVSSFFMADTCLLSALQHRLSLPIQ